MSHSDVLSDARRLPGHTETRCATVGQGIPLKAVSHSYRQKMKDRLIYGLAIFIFIVAPFGLMFVAAPVAVAFILIAGPNRDTGVPSEASAVHRQQHAPWSMTGLRRRP